MPSNVLPLHFKQTLIPSSSPLLEVEEQNIAGRCQQTFENKKFVEITQQCFALLPQLNFPANNLNFH